MSARAPDDPRCKDCANPRLPGKARCADCLEKAAAIAAERAAELARLGLCRLCPVSRRRKAVAGKRLCKEHLERRAEVERRWQEAKRKAATAPRRAR